jgi:hypothetical protein
VVEARTESVTDPGSLDLALFQPAGLEKIGAGPLMSPPWRVRTRAISAGASSNGTLQVVVLDGMVNPEGQLGEVQVLATSNAGLNQSAMEKAAAWKSLNRTKYFSRWSSRHSSRRPARLYFPGLPALSATLRAR